MRTGKRVRVILTAGAVAAMGGCSYTVDVKPIKVEPIDITLRIYIEADQKLDEFFGDGGSGAPAVFEGEGGTR